MGDGRFPFLSRSLAGVDIINAFVARAAQKTEERKRFYFEIDCFVPLACGQNGKSSKKKSIPFPKKKKKKRYISNQSRCKRTGYYPILIKPYNYVSK